MPTFVFNTSVPDGAGVFLLKIPNLDWFKDSITQALAEMTIRENWAGDDNAIRTQATQYASKMLSEYTVLPFNPFPIGMIIAWPAISASLDGYLSCDGSSYNIDDYPELFAVLGYDFGGSGANFNVPDLIGKTLIGAGGSFSPQSVGGEEEHTLVESEIPSHVHTIPLTATTLAVEPGEVTVLTPVPILTQNTGATGGGGSHNNMQPYIALNYLIYAGR
jgi:microcystin-dependent protein